MEHSKLRMLLFGLFAITIAYFAYVALGMGEACALRISQACAQGSEASRGCQIATAMCNMSTSKMFVEIDYLSARGVPAVFGAAIISALICFAYFKQKKRNMLIIWAIISAALFLGAVVLFMFPTSHGP